LRTLRQQLNAGIQKWVEEVGKIGTDVCEDATVATHPVVEEGIFHQPEATESEGKHAQSCIYVDIASSMPQTLEGAWDHDGLHCAPAGYDKIAESIFEQAGDFLLPSKLAA
jgi:lysophospholipase L1-like esterase